MLTRLKTLFTNILGVKEGTQTCEAKTTHIAEPIASFVKLVKDNPSRFTFEGVANYKYGKRTADGGSYYTRKFQANHYGAYHDLYRFTDKKLGHYYEVLVFNLSAYGKDNRDTYDTQPNYITCYDEGLSFVTQLEWLFIEEQLYLPYLDRLRVISDMKLLRESRNNSRRRDRARKKRVALQEKQRETYYDIYCKAER